MKKKHIILLIVALLALAIYIYSQTDPVTQVPDFASKATSNVDANKSDKLGQALPTVVTCNFGASTVKLVDGTTEVTFSWNITQGADGYIDDGSGLYGSIYATTSTKGVNVKKIITKPTTFTLLAGDSIATSTCTITVQPL